MKRQPYLSIAIIVLWLVVGVLLCVAGLRGLGAQDGPPITTLFTFSCYVTEEGYATVLVQSDGVEHYTFDNVDGIDTTIPNDFTTAAGTYTLGRMSIYGTYNLVLMRDDGMGATLSMTPDWQVWCDKDTTPPEGTLEPTEAPITPSPDENAENGFLAINPAMPMSTPAPMYKVRMCVIQYPKVILVCHE